ncbi:hypothetical protein, partial [Streptococcus pneumoniae]|uniref:hypothetical protein n=1 Tax=Streptococcus pneumoniae TaxID=1313 RepID=UPI001E6267CA
MCGPQIFLNPILGARGANIFNPFFPLKMLKQGLFPTPQLPTIPKPLPPPVNQTTPKPAVVGDPLATQRRQNARNGLD